MTMAFGTPFSEAELENMAAQADSGDTNAADESVDDSAWTYDDGSTATGSTTMSIRLPVSVLAALKIAAEDAGTGVTVLARQWITERLAASGGLSAGSVSVGELLAFVTSHAEVIVHASDGPQEIRLPDRRSKVRSARD